MCFDPTYAKIILCRTSTLSICHNNIIVHKYIPKRGLLYIHLITYSTKITRAGRMVAILTASGGGTGIGIGGSSNGGTAGHHHPRGTGVAAPRSRRWHPLFRVLPQFLILLLSSTMSFYGGVLTGMHLNDGGGTVGVGVVGVVRGGGVGGGGGGGGGVGDAPRPDDDVDGGGGGEDFGGRANAEAVTGADRLLRIPSPGRGKGSGEKKGGVDDDGGGSRRRRFPPTVSKIAAGASLIRKDDFLSAFDYGIPIPPSKRRGESDPGKDEVLLLYGGEGALPDDDEGGADAAVYYVERGGGGGGDDIDDRRRQPPIMSASDATKNCGGLNVIYVESHDSKLNLCTAIVGNFESYHVQRWLRTDPVTYARLDTSLPLTPVGRGLQTNGMDKFSAPSDTYALRNQALLETYFARLEGTIDKLTPMATSCAGKDNTVIVMVCNTGQSDLLINFICSARARGFGDVVNEKVLVFATDEGMLKIARGLGLNAFYDEEVSWWCACVFFDAFYLVMDAYARIAGYRGDGREDELYLTL
jgi:hypothetical protein